MNGPYTLDSFLPTRDAWRRAGVRTAFTNGCFDLLHAGHVRYLREARLLGDRLVVGLNGDESVRRLKGAGRPVTPEEERAEILCALECVDAVVIFDEGTPLVLVQAVTPEILVKGGDWTLDTIVGRDHVEAHGGTVRTIPVLEGRSTSNLIEKIQGSKGLDSPAGPAGS